MTRPPRSPEVARLEGLFRHIERHRMAGVPVLNGALQVRAVGFRSWSGYQLGVLITPWFMNLILLGEGDGADVLERSPGEKVRHLFPSGVYEFIVAEEPVLGRYQACSLFSPMNSFDSQVLAEATAREVLSGLMREENRSGVATCSREIERAWSGADEPSSREPIAGEGGVGDCRERSLTRRQLLTGGAD